MRCMHVYLLAAMMPVQDRLPESGIHRDCTIQCFGYDVENECIRDGCCETPWDISGACAAV